MGTTTARSGIRRTVTAGALLAALAAVVAGLGYGTGPDRDTTASTPTPAAPRVVPVRDLQVGDCFHTPSDGETVPAAWEPLSTVTVVPCGQRHFGEVYATTPLQGLTLPGGALESHRRCEELLPGYALDRWALLADARVSHIDPAPTGGTAMTVCTLATASGRTSTLRQDRSRLTEHQLAYLEAESRVAVDLGLQPGTPVSQAPEAYRDWLAALARSTEAEAALLGSHPWGDRAAEPMATLADGLRTALTHLRTAERSSDPATVERELHAARTLLADDTGTAAARAALGLPSTPPTDGSPLPQRTAAPES